MGRGWAGACAPHLNSRPYPNPFSPLCGGSGEGTLTPPLPLDAQSAVRGVRDKLRLGVHGLGEGLGLGERRAEVMGALY